MPEKEKKSRGIILPFTGKVFKERCYAIRKYYNLHSQCTNKKPKQNDYCSTCSKHLVEEKPAYGDIRDRLNIGLMDYVDPFGKRTLPFYKVMKRMKVTKEEVLNAAKQEGIIIPEAHWGYEEEPDKPKEEEEQTKARQRGRPCKNTNIINECDLIDKCSFEKTYSILAHENHEYLWCSTTNEVFDIDTEAKIGTFLNNKIKFC